MLDIFEEIARMRSAGERGALATVISTRGSTPGKETMRLLVRASGTFTGTVGGGCVEADVVDAALEVIELSMGEPTRTMDAPGVSATTSASSSGTCGVAVTEMAVTVSADEAVIEMMTRAGSVAMVVVTKEPVSVTSTLTSCIGIEKSTTCSTVSPANTRSSNRT